MKKSANIVNLEIMVQEIAKAHKNLREQIASVRIAVNAMEAESEKMQEALEAVTMELMKAKENESKKRPSKLWHITYTFHGTTKEFWCARDVYDALGGKTIKGFCEMVDGCKRGDCVQLHRSTVKLCGCPEYKGDSLSYWLDEEAVDCATEWMAMRDDTMQHHKSRNRSYDEVAVIRRYEETRNAREVAKEFNMHESTVCSVLKKHGVRIQWGGHNLKITKEVEAEIIRLHTEGLTQKEIARIVGVCPSAVSVVLRNNGIGRGLDR